MPQTPESSATPKRKNFFLRFLGALGPGVVTGAADDDPSGIATYTVAGAQLGTQLLWLAWITWPLMGIVQMVCARIGMVTGRGLAANLRQKIPRWVLVVVCVALFAANTLNVGADLAGMADASEMLTGINSHYFLLVFALGISAATLLLRYTQIANVLKWLALILFAYIWTAIDIHPDWLWVLHEGFVPQLPKTAVAWATVVAILGTTISPYLFFWQASQEVEEEKAMGRTTLAARRNATPRELRNRRLDVGVGTFFSNLVMFFIILTAALTLHAHGITTIETSRQAAEALKPLAGTSASLLYTLGLLGTGLLAIPTLTGSAAYALAETFGWRQGLDAKLTKARAFYGTIAVSTVIAVVLDYSNVNPIRVLFLSAVANGLLAPILLVGILLVARDSKVMNGQPSSRLSLTIVFVVAVLMAAAGVLMFVF